MRVVLTILVCAFAFGGPSTASAQERERPFIHFTTEPSFASGSVAPGGALVTAEVKHSLTGALSTEVRTAAWFNSQGSLPAGAPVYGVPVENNEIMWCAPIRRNNGWRARCMVRSGSRYFSLDNLTPAFSILYVVYEVGAARTPASATAPNVERQDVSFGGPLRLELRFTVGAIARPACRSISGPMASQAAARSGVSAEVRMDQSCSPSASIRSVCRPIPTTRPMQLSR
jgi:hypothetical protein